MIQISEEQKILLNNLRRAVKEKVAPVAAETDRTGRFNPQVASLFWELGLLQIMLSEEYGGWPQNASYTLCLAIEEFSFLSLSATRRVSVLGELKISAAAMLP